jgi:ABC-type thiamin/hydroxymethylpyrimidine transport system permease subunit
MPTDLIIVVLVIAIIVGGGVYLLYNSIHNVITAAEARLTALIHRQPTPPPTTPLK